MIFRLSLLLCALFTFSLGWKLDKLYSFESYNFPKKSIGLKDNVAIQLLPKSQATNFRIVPALNGKPGAVSFELEIVATRHSTYKLYIRQQNFVLKLRTNYGTQSFIDSASFYVRDNKYFDGYVAFESTTNPGYYIHHHNTDIILYKEELHSNVDRFKKDSSFKFVPYVCEDRNQYCSAWAAQGYCAGSKYMQTNCSLSCKKCFPDRFNELVPRCWISQHFRRYCGNNHLNVFDITALQCLELCTNNKKCVFATWHPGYQIWRKDSRSVCLFYHFDKKAEECQGAFGSIILHPGAKMIRCHLEADTMSNCKHALVKRSCTSAESASMYRSIDGTCNNIKQPTLGAAKTTVKRELRAKYFDPNGLDTPLGFPTVHWPKAPTPHEVSKNAFEVTMGANQGQSIASIMHMSFGQFYDHDITLVENGGGCKNPKCSPGLLKDFLYPCFPIRQSSKVDRGCSSFSRSFPVCQNGKRTVRNQMNFITAYIDLSQVYGSEEELAQDLRSRDGNGTLRGSPNNRMPFNTESHDACSKRGGCFLAGDIRVNENIALASIHTIFFREHNRIAKNLKEYNPDWNDEELYQVARQINTAIYQHIVFKEYTELLHPPLGPYKGYDETLSVQVSNGFASAAFRFAHSQIKDFWGQFDKGFNPLFDNIQLQDSFFNNKAIFEHGIDPTLFGLLGNSSNSIDRSFARGVFEKLFIEPGTKGRANLAAINIQRGRDHGIPGYNEWREHCGLKKAIYSFDEFSDEITDPKNREILKKTYHSVNNHIDLFVGGLSETPLPGFLVGKTFQCIIRKHFEEARDGDRFYYENNIFNNEQLMEIKKATMSKVLCNNMNDIVSIQVSAFKQHREGDKRVMCDKIPDVDLSKWKE